MTECLKPSSWVTSLIPIYFLNSAVSTEAIVSYEDHSLRWSGNCSENIANFPQLQATGTGISILLTAVSILRICLLTKGTLFGSEATKSLAGPQYPRQRAVFCVWFRLGVNSSHKGFGVKKRLFFWDVLKILSPLSYTLSWNYGYYSYLCFTSLVWFQTSDLLHVI